MTPYQLSPYTIGLTLLLTLLTVSLAASVVCATDVYLLAFLAILAAVLFANLARCVGKWLPLPYGANLAMVVSSLAVLFGATVFFFGWRIDHQLQQTSKTLDQSLDEVVARLEKSPTARALVSRVPFLDELLPTDFGKAADAEESNSNGEGTSQDAGDRKSLTTQGQTNKGGSESGDIGWMNVGEVKSVSGKVFGLLGKLFSTTLGFSMNSAFILFVGVFLAIKPNFYRDNFAKLFPKAIRNRAIEIMDLLGDTLFSWLQGRGATMAITGVGTSMVLYLLGVPLALTLGIITGLLTFIPTIGAFLALLLSTLVALSQGPTTVIWVVVLYAVLQFAESNIITPLVQQHQTSVPPPLLLTAQLMMGVLAGFLGVLVSTPLMACLIVMVREAYVVDVLEDDSAAASK